MRQIRDEVVLEADKGFRRGCPTEQDVLVRSEALKDEILPQDNTRMKSKADGGRVPGWLSELNSFLIAEEVKRRARVLQETFEEFEVERIVDHRGVSRHRRYLVKWAGYEAPTWIRRSDFVTTEIVEEFEKKLAMKPRRRRRSARSTRDARILAQSGFDLGLKVERIVGAGRVRDAMVYVVLYNNGQEGLVSDTELYTNAPEQVIEFLEKNMTIVG